MLGVLRMPYDLFWADDPVLRLQHDAVRLEAADELDRLTATPCIPWRHCSEHGDAFEDDETMMVAVPVRDNRTGKSHWEIECVVARVDDMTGTCSLESLLHDEWGWDWSSVEWWLPMSEVLGTLPAVEAANAAERQGEG